MASEVTSEHLTAFISKMKTAGLSPVVIDSFSHYYKKIIAGESGLIYDRDISCVEFGDIDEYDQLQNFESAGRRALGQTVKITLNGGLGSSMALSRTKSLLELKPGTTFLEIILRQSDQNGIRSALMNSFSSQADTLSFLSKLKPARQPLLFLQHQFPKILQTQKAPAAYPQNPELEWNPPGHGDVYSALLTSGMLKKLLAEGVTYAFICNSDNLGASVDQRILGFLAENRIPFIMEVSERTPSDTKGGHLARLNGGTLILRESSQCPADELDAFGDFSCYRFFNTNNIWINLNALNELIDRCKIIRLPLILNSKTLNPQDPDSPPVYQVETAMGAAISLFEGARAVNVPRSRFSPVKNCNDLLVVRSDRHLLSENAQLVLNPQNATEIIRVRLDPDYYSRIDFFEERFRYGIPSLKDCESLTVKGDVLFESDVSVKGRVVIQNDRPNQAVIQAGTVIDSDLKL